MDTEFVLQELRKLSRADKLRAMQVLVMEMAAEEDARLPEYENWSPIVSEEALHNLLKFKEEREKARAEHA